jgi:hypothetical protein
MVWTPTPKQPPDKKDFFPAILKKGQKLENLSFLGQIFPHFALFFWVARISTIVD